MHLCASKISKKILGVLQLNYIVMEMLGTGERRGMNKKFHALTLPGFGSSDSCIPNNKLG
jgi:hypothetical protein